MALDLADWPRPLGMRPLLVRSGISVATYRPGAGIGNFYPASPWGTLAVASAQVGYWSGRDGSGTNEVRLLRELRSNEAVFRNMGDSETLSFEENDLRNFFYSMDPADGVAFGARLVPAAREYTWGDDPTMNVLLGSGAWSRGWWRRVPDPAQRSPAGATRGAGSGSAGTSP